MDVPPAASTSAEPHVPPIVDESAASAEASSSHKVSSSSTSPSPPSFDQATSTNDNSTSPVETPKRSGRNLVLFFDGTGNSFNERVTNVSTLYSFASKDTTDQLCYYQTGIGTRISTSDSPWPFRLVDWAEGWLDYGIAWSLGTHVQKGYQFLMNYYQPGDSIFLFGFSRGAYTARALAGMLQQVGLLFAGNEETLPLAYSIYKNSGEQHNSKREAQAQDFKRIYSRPVEVEFVGVFDTVSSVGILGSHQLPFASGSSFIDHFRHALALDEVRCKYAPELWEAEDAGTSTVKEVWFVGSHSNVGGGALPYDRDASPSLSALPLRWMLREAVECGFKIDTKGVESSPLYAPHLGHARKAIEGTDIPGLGEYLERARSQNSNLVDAAAACVYVASVCTGEADRDAVAERTDEVSYRIEARGGEKVPMTIWEGFKYGLMTPEGSFWWAIETFFEGVAFGYGATYMGPVPPRNKSRGSRTLQAVHSRDWKTVHEYFALRSFYAPSRIDLVASLRSWHSNRGHGRCLPSSPSSHFSVQTRLKASDDGYFRWKQAVPAVFVTHYKPKAVFRPGKSMENVVWVD
ncbi:hypothetical protein JCM8097_004939 [Rhodosporidiobolus ruineniae]